MWSSMVSSSRRAFLSGRTIPQSPWAAFCHRLRRDIQGLFLELDSTPGLEQGRLHPGSSADVELARQLAAEYSVQLALGGVPMANPYHTGAVLYLAPDHRMSRCERLEPNSTLWFVQPGCLIGELEAQGFSGLHEVNPGLTVAAWLADRRYHMWPQGFTQLSGVEHAAILLADGTRANLGPFGANNKNPLNSLRLQQMIPALFQLQASSVPHPEHYWTARYRLDALQPDAAYGINLAHLLLGHGGDLAWVDWLVLDQQMQALAVPDDWQWPMPQDMNVAATQDQDEAVRQWFDPVGLFSYPGQEL